MNSIFLFSSTTFEYLFFTYVLTRMVLNAFVSFTSQKAALIFTKSINAFFVLLFTVFVFLAYYSFANKNKVWESVGNTFHLIKKHCSKLWKMFLFIVFTGLIISIISFYIEKQLFLQPLWITTSVSIGILLLFLSWMRLYLVKGLQNS